MADLKEILLSKSVVVPENFSFFKDLFKHYRGKQVQGIEGDKRPLLEKREDFYLQPAKSGFLQGDILSNLPPVWLAQDESGELSPFISEPQMAMVISTECDCEQRTNAQTHIRLCPIMHEDDLLDGQDASIRGNLRANYYSEYFWMPALEQETSNLVADLSHIYSVQLEDIHELVLSTDVQKTASLSEDAYFLLLIKLAWFVLRPAPPDTARKGLEKWK